MWCDNKCVGCWYWIQTISIFNIFFSLSLSFSSLLYSSCPLLSSLEQWITWALSSWVRKRTLFLIGTAMNHAHRVYMSRGGHVSALCSCVCLFIACVWMWTLPLSLLTVHCMWAKMFFLLDFSQQIASMFRAQSLPEQERIYRDVII